MTLNTAQQQQFRDWLAARQIKATCPACGTQNQWELDEVVTAPRMDAAGVHIDSQVAPILQVVCQHCAYILLFAGIPIGIYPRKGASRATHSS